MSKLMMILLIILSNAVYSQSDFQLRDGSEIQAYLAIGEIGAESSQGSVLPLAIVMGGGAGNGRIASGAFQSLGQEFAKRGWAVAVPVSPNGQSFWGGNAEKVRELIGLLKARDDVADGPVLLVGVSNGGISALEIASRNPQEYKGVVAVPALASNSSALSSLKNFPVYLRIGSEDRLDWANRFDSSVDILTSVGVKLDALLLQDTGHTFPLDWSRLEPWLISLTDG